MLLVPAVANVFVDYGRVQILNRSLVDNDTSGKEQALGFLAGHGKFSAGQKVDIAADLITPSAIHLGQVFRIRYVNRIDKIFGFL